jgi:L-2,4-diaminobutyric acid acetyltransferase|tara:strand:+ start:607 stop:1137 length:531 start_codon:yes stop_codon:yes gene_type:complete
MTIEVYSKKNTAIKITHPNKKNGLAIARLVERCPPLDLNSTYHYFIQSHYFSKTSAVAFDNNEVIAFASGFILPENNNSLFIWQVAIDESYRGQGLGIELINFILEQNHSVNTIETTVTKSNSSSRRMFEKISQKYESTVSEKVLFDGERDFSNEHESEILITISTTIQGKKDEDI